MISDSQKIDSSETNNLFWLVPILIALYVVLDAIAQLLPPHYSPISQAESDLAVGPYGFVMAINFINRGILSLAFVYALYKFVGKRSTQFRPGLYLLGLWGAASLLLSAFPTDVPPSSPTVHGTIHLVLAVIAFFCGALGVLTLSLRFGTFPKLSSLKRAALAISLFAVAFFVLLFGLPFILPHLAERIGGLIERIFLGLVLLWMLLVSVYIVKK